MFDKDNKFGFISNNKSNNNIEGLDKVKTDINNIKSEVNELNTQYKKKADKISINIKDYGAKGDGTTDDTLAIQTALDKNNYNCEIVFPKGVYKITKSLLIPASSFGLIIKGYGATIIANKSSFTGDFILNFTPATDSSWPAPQNFTIIGLYFNGNYVSGGINIDVANYWLLSNVQFWNCITGLNLCRTYYGEISSMSSFRSCLVGINFNYSSKEKENNCININQVAINGGYSNKTKFIAKNTGETTAEYDTRVISKGIAIASTLHAVKIWGVTIEGMDYGIYEENIPGKGNIDSIFTIENCYFEFNAYAGFMFNQPLDTDNHYRHIPKITFANNRLYNDKDKRFLIRDGRFKIYQNEDIRIEIDNGMSYIDTDTDIYIDNSIGNARINYVGNEYKYIMEDAINSEYRTLPVVKSIDKFNTIKNYNIRNVSNKANLIANYNYQSKPVNNLILGTDGVYYYPEIIDGVMYLRICNPKIFTERANSYSAYWLYQNKSNLAEGVVYKINELNDESAQYKDGCIIKTNPNTNIDNANQELIGTTKDILDFKTNIYPAWDLNTNQGICRYNGTIDGIRVNNDCFGNVTTNNQIRAMGPTSSMPSSDIDMGGLARIIYFDTNQSKYFILYNGINKWKPFTPLTV